MSRKISIITVCASVVLSCLAMLPLTVSGNMESQDTKKSASPNHEKVEPWFKTCHSQAAREAVACDCIKGIERIFKTVRDELKVRRNKKVCGKEPEHDSSIIDAAYTETIVIWRGLLDDVFGNIPSDHPLATSKIKNAAIYQMVNLADAVYMGINVTANSRSSTSLTELQTLQDKASCSLSNMGSKFYVDMRIGHKYDAETNAVIDCHLKNTLAAGVDSVRNVFHGIRILMTAIDSEAKTGIEDDLPLLEDLMKNANQICKDWTEYIFDSVDLLCRIHSKEC